MQYEKYYGLTVYEMLKKATELFGEKLVFSYKKNEHIIEVTYNQLWNDVQKIACRLDEHKMKGKYVIIEGKANYEMVISIFASISMGAVVAVLNLDLPDEEIFYAIDCLQPSMIICTDDGYEVVEEYAEEKKIFCVKGEGKEKSICSWLQEEALWYEPEGKQNPESPALVLMTSGSTSKSKIVLLTHYAFLPSLEFYGQKNILVFPLHHIAGIWVLASSIAKGMHVCLSNMRSGLRDIEWFCPDDITAVPAFISAVVKRSKQGLLDISTCKSIVSAGAPQNLEETRYLDSLGIFTASVYGATETGGSVVCINSNEHRFGTVGKPGSWNEIKISENGEILVKGKNVMLEYIGNPEETEVILKDGWYYSGDVGCLDEDGFLYITGRMKNIIILSNGENVSPEAIEAQLYHCPDIDEVLVYGEQDTITAHVWCGANFGDKEKKNIELYIAKYNRSVPSYRCIRKIVFCEKPFEKTATGKIKR